MEISTEFARIRAEAKEDFKFTMIALGNVTNALASVTQAMESVTKERLWKSPMLTT